MRLAGGVSMNGSVEAPKTHHSTQQGPASLAPPRVPPGVQPLQRLLPATRWALRPPVAPIPIPPARTTACPPKPEHQLAQTRAAPPVVHLLGPAPMATSVTIAPGSRLSAAICAFKSSGQRFRPAPAYTSIRGDNGRLMSSEWSSIMSTLAEDDSSSGALTIEYNNSQGPQRHAYRGVVDDRQDAEAATVDHRI